MKRILVLSLILVSSLSISKFAQAANEASEATLTSETTEALEGATQVRDDEAIFNALNAPEVYLNPGYAGVSRIQKSVGGLVCIRSLVIVPRAVPSYICTLAQ